MISTGGCHATCDASICAGCNVSGCAVEGVKLGQPELFEMKKREDMELERCWRRGALLECVVGEVLAERV